MKRVVYLVVAALVALMILVPAAVAQHEPLPKSGGPEVSTVLLPAAALLLGSGILVYIITRRR